MDLTATRQLAVHLLLLGCVLAPYQLRAQQSAPAPVANPPRRVETLRGQPVKVYLSGSSSAGSKLAVEIKQHPAHGTLTDPPIEQSTNKWETTYTPSDPGWDGKDSFRFLVKDGSVWSAEVEVPILVLK